MRSILAVLWGSHDASTILDAAHQVAAAGGHGGKVTALYIRPSAENFIPTGDFGLALSQEYFDRIQKEGIDIAAKLQKLFHEKKAKLSDSKVTWQWREIEGAAPLILASEGRVYDLIVMAKPDPEQAIDTDIILEAGLFETGRPVLIVPVETKIPPRPIIFRTVLIAWNGSPETARTIGLSMPLLSRADKIYIHSSAAGFVPGPSGEELAEYFAAHGFKTEISHDHDSSIPAGEAHLARAKAVNADVIIKGAYTHSRLRNFVFGGATRHIIAHTSLPVLLAH
ncbi:MAG: universal stress protein [Alphaproteobacteria bacterium]|nr:universal stress protein [Alphaproteobacteria bacterium]